MNTTATEIDLEPLHGDAGDGPPLLDAALPFLGSLQVEVLVSIGGATIGVTELLELQKGSVISLDRRVEQPLDIVVSGHVIARGVLVAVGEHFGVRVCETVRVNGRG